jgi:hypothetical protein
MAISSKIIGIGMYAGLLDVNLDWLSALAVSR